MEMVKVTDEQRLLPAYGTPEAEEMPLFAENRVHQRSNGNPYPNKAVLRVDRKHRENRPFRVIALENEYLRVELMPELGGRIYSALDKRTGYDFFYKQHVIKPALIGMLGSWISGGCEFNWPCHHRPSTFMPVDVDIQREPDGAVTVWMSENEPLDRMKGMVGVRLAPGEARIDTRMRVFNRTPQRHSFLWWENAAVPVNENYRLLFPPDVRYVQFHYRKNVTSYPVASGVYNGIRMGDGVDISYHKNTRQPTSYFCAETRYDFFGGYDEGRKCGVIHVADHTVGVGKKMFTWAYNQLSHSWEKALTDTDGPYAELMAGSYSLNQPDFAWLMPYESKEFSQMWYPVGDMGIPLCACKDAAVSVREGSVVLQPTAPLRGFRLKIGDQEYAVEGGPDRLITLPLKGDASSIALYDREGSAVLRYQKPGGSAPVSMPATIPDNPALNTLRTAQEAYLMGVHTEQYRDPAARPDAYWREALNRDPEYAPALEKLAEYELTHLRPRVALELAKRAWNKLTWRNFHPESGETAYLMGRILEALGEDGEAWEWYMQAAWAQDARSRALTRAAMIEGRRGDHRAMARLADKALKDHSGNETALLLRALAKTHYDRDGARLDAETLLKQDRLSMPARLVLNGPQEAFFTGLGADKAQSALDISEECWEAGEKELAVQMLKALPQKTAMTEYVRAFLSGDDQALDATARLDTGIAYPSRWMEYQALKYACEKRPRDGKAHLLLGCILYARENYAQADAAWETARAADPGDYIVYRNLAVARYSHLNRRREALPLLDRALALHPHDGQLIWEKALVMTRLGEAPEKIAAFLETENSGREDNIIELCRAYNRMGAWEKALSLLEKTDFTPCEGGEHAVAEQYMFAHYALGRKALNDGNAESALEHFQAAQRLPDHLGAGLWNEVLLTPHAYYEAVCLLRLGKREEAERRFQWIVSIKQDYFSNMHLPELPCWQAMAYRALGLSAPAQEKTAAHLRAQEAAEQARDAGYFGTTPFFISYMEDAGVQRQGAVSWQRAMICFASGDGDGAREWAIKTLRSRPDHLYAGLMANG